MCYEELSLKGFVKEIKEVSSGPHPRKFCFVLGAGASKTSGIKSGQELVNIWDKELLERSGEQHLRWKNRLGINEENKETFYSQYYERRFKRQPIDGYNYLEKLMERAKPSIGYVMLSHLLTQTKHNVVITTNFDHLVEDAVTYYTQTIPLVIGHESLAHYVSKQINRPMIIKIHRDLLFDPKNRIDEVETLHENWEKALGNIFSEYHPVFIGYAGNDNSLMDYLIKNNNKFLEGEWTFPYWMMYKTDSINSKISEFLEKTDGYVIKHNGFDEVLCLLGATFDYKLPSEEEFLNDAKKRFLSLKNAIDGFSNESLACEDTRSAVMVPEAESQEVEQAIQKITNQTELQHLYRKAVLFNNNGEYEEAMKIKRQLIQREPENARYYNSFSVTLHEMKRYEEALAATQKAIDLEPENAEYRGSLGVTLHEMKRYEEALAAKQKAIDLEPENAKYRNSLGVTLHEMKRYEEALAATQKAIDLEPKNAKYRNSLGVTLHKMERYEEALAATQKAIELEPENARYHNGHSVTLHEMKRYEEALAATQKAVELEPENAQYRNSLGVTLHEMKRYEEALAAKQKAVELEPENARYHNSHSVTLHGMKRYEEALAATQKAVELEPENATYRNSLGVTLHEMKRYEEALAAKQKAVELEPENASYRAGLNLTLRAMKKTE